ncbi:hypothetical protein Aspvir_007863 [Aspergillus viridinutans]|uniref:Cytochrome P450 n=1 Tax=Aspergillus viridinutans TaxID=75553 RepID=A0A9P3C4I0_ASPVI|nr:uncharacterized protein Aspvir_007863 [Aspergillus viridinutans]GIK03789.1 hypothetical protein Aspvir_007863 [Aspergillus viridinutans]
MAIEIFVVTVAVAIQLLVSPIPEASTIKILLSYFAGNCAVLAWQFQTTQAVKTAFPGPKSAAISKLWAANQCRLGRTVLTLKRLHEQYDSDIIRIGPNEVSINNVEAVHTIYKGRYQRGFFYEFRASNGELNLNTTRDYAKHSAWRKIWERAFSPTEILNYNKRVEHHAEKFITILKSQRGAAVNCSKLMDDLMFDITMDLGFGSDAGMQDGMGDGQYIQFLHKYACTVTVLSALRNAGELLCYLPVSAEVKAFRERGKQVVNDRQRSEAVRTDVFRHFLHCELDPGVQFSQTDLNTNALLILGAGTETTSSTASQILRLLAENPCIQSKLRAELDSHCSIETKLTVEMTRNLPYLNAVVSEGLRLVNPVPSGVPAITPPDGVYIGDVYIPGNVEVRIPSQVLMTDSRYFPQGGQFIPERWTGEMPELILDRRAYIPFGYGVHSCIGRQVALNEMRLVVGRVVKEFIISLGELYDAKQFSLQTKDYLTVQLASLPLKFTPRPKNADSNRGGEIYS